MKRALTGDKQAYAALLHQTARFVRPYLAKRLNLDVEVDDVLQDILLSIHKARHTYDAKRPYKPWAWAIVRFRLHDHLRSHYADHLRHAADLSELDGHSAADDTDLGISYESIRSEVERLPPKQAAILDMMHREGYTAREVARAMGMSESAVKVAAFRAYGRLRSRLNTDGEN